MGDLSEFSITVRTFLRAYPWRRIDPVPWQVPRKPTSESRLALVSSAGFVESTQPFFDRTMRGGDYSFRKISADTPLESLIDTHRSESYDHAGVASDPNLAFPLDRLRELCAAGLVGSSAGRHLSFMGSITAPGRLVRDTAPEAARHLLADGVELAILVPV